MVILRKDSKPPMLVRSSRDPAVVKTDFAERIITARDWGPEANYAGFADYVFNTMVKNFLAILMMLMDYGHPTMWDAKYVLTEGVGVSGSTETNEDIIGGYTAHQRHAGRRILVNFLRWG